MSSQSSKFKIKRPRSPDLIGIHNYKKQRLIEDLENLTLSDRSNLKDRRFFEKSTQSLVNEPEPTFKGIYMPHSTKLKALELLHSNENDGNSILYSKLKEVLRKELLQIIKWTDPPRALYGQWLSWLHKKNLSMKNIALMCNDIHNPPTFDYSQDWEGDIDMDT